MSTIQYTVPNISCKHCVHTVTTELSDLQGVQDVNVDLESKQVTVAYDAPASPEKIEALLTEINYPAAK
jgi:copper chaperone CopZ